MQTSIDVPFKSTMRRIVEMLIPRFITEEVGYAFVNPEDEDDDSCVFISFCDFIDDDEIHGFCTIKYFNFFGFDLFISMVEDSDRETQYPEPPKPKGKGD